MLTFRVSRGSLRPDPITILDNQASAMQILFWLLTGIATYVYVGYPVLLRVIGALRGARAVTRSEARPAVSLVISAFNEERVIADKLRNSLNLDYPRGLLHIIVVSDASSDRTDEIVAGFAAEGVELLRMPQRAGKTAGLNEVIQRLRGEIVVFSDANAMYQPDAVAKLVRNFSDANVGCAVGESRYYDSKTQSERSEGFYWAYETAIKRLESRIGSVVGGDGAIYAIRRSLYVPMAADTLSDFVNPLQIVRAGYRCVYEPEAQSFEYAGSSFRKEFARKVRIVNRGWRATLAMRELLNPLRHRVFAVELISHKLLRWLMPVNMVALFIVNAFLARSGPLFAILFGVQLLFYSLAALGHLLRKAVSLPTVLSVPYYFCLVNLASAIGIIDAYRGRTYATWTPMRTNT
jgi:cellulose synthase/poly-beta-1,6-N-acetylglucosamine synthase-like glycosyltransferase